MGRVKIIDNRINFINTATGVIVEHGNYEALIFIPGEHVVQGYGDDEENYYFVPLEGPHKCQCHGGTEEYTEQMIKGLAGLKNKARR